MPLQQPFVLLHHRPRQSLRPLRSLQQQADEGTPLPDPLLSTAPFTHMPQQHLPDHQSRMRPRQCVETDEGHPPLGKHPAAQGQHRFPYPFRHPRIDPVRHQVIHRPRCPAQLRQVPPLQPHVLQPQLRHHPSPRFHRASRQVHAQALALRKMMGQRDQVRSIPTSQLQDPRVAHRLRLHPPQHPHRRHPRRMRLRMATRGVIHHVIVRTG